MLINVQSSNGLAIYDQIVRQVKFAIASEAIRSGELLPSVRELAKEVAVNPNTVARAYRELQSDGILESVRGKGMQITSKAFDRCRSARLKLIRQRLRDVLVEADRSGLTTKELRDLTRQELEKLNGKTSR